MTTEKLMKELAGMDLAQLRARYFELYGEESKGGAEYLRRKIAYAAMEAEDREEIVAEASEELAGELSEKTARAIAERATAAEEEGEWMKASELFAQAAAASSVRHKQPYQDRARQLEVHAAKLAKQAAAAVKKAPKPRMSISVEGEDGAQKPLELEEQRDRDRDRYVMPLAATADLAEERKSAGDWDTAANMWRAMAERDPRNHGKWIARHHAARAKADGTKDKSPAKAPKVDEEAPAEETVAQAEHRIAVREARKLAEKAEARGELGAAADAWGLVAQLDVDNAAAHLTRGRELRALLKAREEMDAHDAAPKAELAPVIHADLASTILVSSSLEKELEALPPHTDRRIPAVGTVLEREHDGRKYRVQVAERGFILETPEGERSAFKSLSGIGRLLTNRNTNGFAWFHLTEELPPAKAAADGARIDEALTRPACRSDGPNGETCELEPHGPEGAHHAQTNGSSSWMQSQPEKREFVHLPSADTLNEVSDAITGYADFVAKKAAESRLAVASLHRKIAEAHLELARYLEAEAFERDHQAPHGAKAGA